METYQGKTVLGIDLGTTKSGAALYNKKSDKVEMVPLPGDTTIVPSVVAWDREHERWLVGQEAKRYASLAPAAVARSIKRYIGRPFADRTITLSQPERAFQLEAGRGDAPLEDVLVSFGSNQRGDTVRLSAPGVSSKVLAYLRDEARGRLPTFGYPEETIEDVVITVPAYFNANQRNATILAGRMAGFSNIEIINEPTAAALAYRDRVLEPDATRRILVYDLGGGTFDVSILKVTLDELGFNFYTEVVDGNTRLGGDDIDHNLVQWLRQRLVEQLDGRQIRTDDRVSYERLRQAAEGAKIELSAAESAHVRIEDLALGDGSPVQFETILTREELETIAEPVIRQAREICSRAVEQLLRRSWEEIHDVVLVGGQTLMPVIRRDIAAFSGKEPVVLDRPQEAVALGAGEYGYTLSLGAKHFHERMLQHVVALPVGVHLPTEKPSFKALIPANAGPLPIVGKYPVTTTQKDQTHIDVEILQGKSWDAQDREDCDPISTVRMSNLLPAQAGDHRFEVELRAEEDGTLTATVADLTGGLPPEMVDITDRSIAVYRGDVSATATEGAGAPPFTP